MNKLEILELKKRMKIDSCAFNRIAGCCVSSEKEILTTFNSHFLTLEDGEQHKFLDLAKKALSGKQGDNLLEINFPNEAEREGGSQHLLMKLKKEMLKNESTLNELFHRIIDNYDHVGTYAIILFHDSYDVPDRGTDRIKQDESTEVYDYIICVVCPIELSKPGLSYFNEEKKISERVRDWILKAPEIAFTFPAFTDRSSDIHNVIYHIKTPKNAHPEFVENVLGCPMIQTSEEKKDLFAKILEEVLRDENNPEKIIYDINDSLRKMIEDDNNDVQTGETPRPDDKIESIVVSEGILKAALMENNISENKIKKVQDAYKSNILTDTTVDQIVNWKLLDSQKYIRREEELLTEIAKLKDENAKLREELRKYNSRK